MVDNQTFFIAPFLPVDDLIKNILIQQTKQDTRLLREVGDLTLAIFTTHTGFLIVDISKLFPFHPPYKRSLYYVYKDPASAGLQAFLGYATSPQGQQALTLGN